MQTETFPAFFLWLGGPLPPLARLSVLSAARAGFRTTLFSDRAHDLSGADIEQADYRDVYDAHAPDAIRIRGREGPAYAAFSDVFRFALLTQRSGWWFDCDTLILRPREDFDALLGREVFVLGREADTTVNGAVIGSRHAAAPAALLAAANTHLPVLETWGVIGPALISASLAAGEIACDVLPQTAFYPVHHDEIGAIFQPSRRVEMEERTRGSYCLSLWNEVLGKTGLRYLAPPPDSHLAQVLTRLFGEVNLVTDRAALADYLVANTSRIDSLDSGRVAMRTILRKASARIGRGRG